MSAFDSTSLARFRADALAMITDWGESATLKSMTTTLAENSQGEVVETETNWVTATQTVAMIRAVDTKRMGSLIEIEIGGATFLATRTARIPGGVTASANQRLYDSNGNHWWVGRVDAFRGHSRLALRERGPKE